MKIIRGRTVQVPAAVLTNSGIGERFWSCSLAQLSESLRKECRRYTTAIPGVIAAGTGVCVVGEDGAVRDNALYGILKSCIAHGIAVRVASVEQLTTALLRDKSLDVYQRATVLGIPEMYPTASINEGMRAAITQTFTERHKRKLPLIVGTSLEPLGDGNSLDTCYPGVGRILKETTVLVNLLSGELPGHTARIP